MSFSAAVLLTITNQSWPISVENTLFKFKVPFFFFTVHLGEVVIGSGLQSGLIAGDEFIVAIFDSKFVHVT